MTTVRNDEHYFGACPECGEQSGSVNVGRVHWIVCDRHKTRWRAGENLFSDWKDETQEIWNSNAELLRGYREIEPLRDAEP